MRKPAKRDPLRKFHLEAAAERRVGTNSQCGICGESRPVALERIPALVICTGCKRRAEGKSDKDDHHVFGRANSPFTISVPANDHRDLSLDQMDWHKEVLENKDGSPLLSAAAHISGFIDSTVCLIEKSLHWIVEMLVRLNRYLVQTLGPKWWESTGIREFAVAGKQSAGRP